MLACLRCLNSSSRRRNRNQASQQGTVLVLVLLIVALVAALSVKFAAQYQLGLARAETRWHGAQARAFLEGTEEVAKLMFGQLDIEQSKDFLGEPWSTEFPIEDQGVSGVARLSDATNQLNLNDLGTALKPETPIGNPERYSPQQKRFIRLLQTFPDMPLGQDQAEYLLEAIVDWIDEDESESGQGGAESNYYQSMPEPYLPANTLFKSLDELRLVRGFNENPLLVMRLMPFITVLPIPKAGLNINTMELVDPVTGKGVNNLLLTINDANSLAPAAAADVQQAIKLRPETGFETSEIQTAFAGKEVTDLNGMATYFWLNATVQLVDQRRSMRSLMVRDKIGQRQSLKVIRRDDVFELPTVVRKDENEDDDGETELVE